MPLPEAARSGCFSFYFECIETINIIQIPHPFKQAWGFRPTRIAHLAAQSARTWASGDIVLSDKPRALAARWSFFLPCPSKQAWGSGKKKAPHFRARLSLSYPTRTRTLYTTHYLSMLYLTKNVFFVPL